MALIRVVGKAMGRADAPDPGAIDDAQPVDGSYRTRPSDPIMSARTRRLIRPSAIVTAHASPGRDGSRSRRSREKPAPQSRRAAPAGSAKCWPAVPWSEHQQSVIMSNPETAIAIRGKGSNVPYAGAHGHRLGQHVAGRQACWNRPPRVPIHNAPSTRSSSDVTIAGGLGTTGRNLGEAPLLSRSDNPPRPPAQTRPRDPPEGREPDVVWLALRTPPA